MVARDGDDIGDVEQVHLDDETGQPEWATVQTEVLGSRETFVPLADAQLSGDSLSVPYTKDLIQDAPAVHAEGSLSESEEAALYAHYGLGYSERPSDSGLSTGTASSGTEAQRGDRAGRGDDAMTRSEERLTVGTEQVESGRARLRKFVTTEQQSANVTVSHDEVRVTREPITDANRSKALDGPTITEAVHEVVLNEQYAVADKEVVPVERIRLGKDVVTETETVTGNVRKEQIELDVPEGTSPRGV